MTVEAYLNRLPGGWYPTAPSRAGRYLRYIVMGPVWGHMATDIVELESRRGKNAVMLVRPVTRQTEKKRGSRWRVRFFSNSLEEAFEHYPGAHNRTNAAYHEAGHAVVAEKLGVPIGTATVEPGGYWTSEGIRLYVGQVRYSERPGPMIDAIVSLAGPVAESMLTNEELTIGGSDIIGVIKYTGKDPERQTDILKRAWGAVTSNWHEIEKLAQTLLLFRTIQDSANVAPDHQEHPAKEASA